MDRAIVAPAPKNWLMTEMCWSTMERQERGSGHGQFRNRTRTPAAAGYS